MKLRELTYQEKAAKVKRYEYLLPCGQMRNVRHWTTRMWVEYIDRNGTWL